jgi:hypothetical protein
MPFRSEFDRVYATIQQAVAIAAPGETISVVRLDQVKHAGKITDDLLEEIRSADFCIADVSDPNGNVMWEVGYAAALQKPTIAISYTAGGLPFDIKDVRIERYDLSNLEVTLRPPLEEAIRQTLSRYEIPRQSRIRRLPERTSFAIAITGSDIAERNRVLRRVQAVASPYLGPNTTWYCGTFGTVDQASAEFLVSQKQRVIAVGHTAYSVSEPMLQILERHNIPLIAADQEQLLKVGDITSKRDLLFVTKADLVILVWDGKSKGTQRILNSVRQEGRDHIVAFV